MKDRQGQKETGTEREREKERAHGITPANGQNKKQEGWGITDRAWGFSLILDLGTRRQVDVNVNVATRILKQEHVQFVFGLVDVKSSSERSTTVEVYC